MFFDRNKGKIIIHLENDNGKLNSKMELRGIANKTETTLTTLLINFASFSIEKEKDPKEILEKHFDSIVDMIKSGKKIGEK